CKTASGRRSPGGAGARFGLLKPEMYTVGKAARRHGMQAPNRCAGRAGACPAAGPVAAVRWRGDGLMRIPRCDFAGISRTSALQFTAVSARLYTSPVLFGRRKSEKLQS